MEDIQLSTDVDLLMNFSSCLQEIEDISSVPINCPKRGDWALDCLRVLGPNFCITLSDNGASFLINVSPSMRQNCIDLLENTAKGLSDFSYDEILKQFKSIVDLGKNTCETLIRFFLLKELDVQDRLKLEEKIKSI